MTPPNGIDIYWKYYYYYYYPPFIAIKLITRTYPSTAQSTNVSTITWQIYSKYAINVNNLIM